MIDVKDFALYIHWPFCQSKCPYCDFNSHVRHGGIDEEGYIEAYRREMAFTAGLTGKRKLHSIFFGGGTPSLMRPQTVEAILGAAAKHWDLDQNTEVTIEANPMSAEAGNFAAYAHAGVNRVSVGVQSFNEKNLKMLGRLHSAGDAYKALEAAEKYFARYSFDLIYTLPDQSLSEWSRELKSALSIAGTHLSLYQLTIEEGTPFYNLRQAGKLAMPNADLSADFFELTQEIMLDAGLPAYEISNHAVPGDESQHNLVYWRTYDFAGIGPGAHGRITSQENRIATAVEPHPETWRASVMWHGHGLTSQDFLTKEEIGDEYLLMGLRLREGVSCSEFAARSDRVLDPLQIENLVMQNMLERLDEDRIRITAAGWTVIDAVVADLAA